LVLSKPTVAMIMPEVQYPHWKASVSRNACCTGCNWPPASSASIVVMAFVPTVPTRVTHDRAPAPSSNTVQAPHCPSPQPKRLPVRPMS
jgi:hypothetical protein